MRPLASDNTDIRVWQIWSHILQEYPQTELTQKQIYARWSQLNEKTWRLDTEQVRSARKVLESFQGSSVEIIPIRPEPGIVAMGFAFKQVFDEFGLDVEEIAMDSTCKQFISILIVAKTSERENERGRS